MKSLVGIGLANGLWPIAFLIGLTCEIDSRSKRQSNKIDLSTAITYKAIPCAMSLLILGFGHVIDDHYILASYGGEHAYVIDTNEDGSYTPPYGTGDMLMDDATEAMSAMAISGGAAGGCGSSETAYGMASAASASGSSETDYGSSSTHSPPTVFDDYRIVGKSVLNIHLTGIVGCPIYMTTYRCDSDSTISCAFTFEPPFISRTCFSKTMDFPTGHGLRPAHVTEANMAMLASLLGVTEKAGPFLFHGVLDMLD